MSANDRTTQAASGTNHPLNHRVTGPYNATSAGSISTQKRPSTGYPSTPALPCSTAEPTVEKDTTLSLASNVTDGDKYTRLEQKLISTYMKKLKGRFSDEWAEAWEGLGELSERVDTRWNKIKGKGAILTGDDKRLDDDVHNELQK